MNRIYFIALFLFGFIFSECADMNKLDCMLSVDCDWDENMVTGNCDNFSSSSTCSNIDQCSWVSTQQACPNITGYSDCVAIPGCSYSWLTYTCGGTTTVTYCSGGSYQFDNGVCNEILMPECSDLNESECYLNNSCDWNESITYGNCGSLSVSACYDYPGECYVDSNPGWYDSSGPYCTGGTYQIDNSYCSEVLILECSDMIELECSNDDECNWVEDVSYGNCSNYNNGSACDANDECFWDLCYGGSYGSWSHCCRGGSFTIDNSYCEDMQFIPGDTNQDFTINVLDIIMIVNLILEENEYNELADLNNDGVNNIQDIIMVVQIILNG